MNKVLELRPTKLTHFRLIMAPLWGLIISLIIAIPLFFMKYPSSNLIIVGTFITITLFQIASALSHHMTVRYEINETHLISTEGITSKIQRSTPLDKITNVDVRQGPLDSMLGIGNIWVFTPSIGSATPEVMLVGMAEPYKIKDLLMQAKASVPSAQISANSKSKINDITENTTLLQEILKTLRNIEDLLREK